MLCTIQIAKVHLKKSLDVSFLQLFWVPLIGYSQETPEGDRQSCRENKAYSHRSEGDFLMVRVRMGFRFASVSVLDEGTRWWSVGSDCKPPGQSTKTTEERSHPSLMPEIYSHNASRRAHAWWVTLLVCSVPPLFCWEYIQCEPARKKKEVLQHFTFLDYTYYSATVQYLSKKRHQVMFTQRKHINVLHNHHLLVIFIKYGIV